MRTRASSLGALNNRAWAVHSWRQRYFRTVCQSGAVPNPQGRECVVAEMFCDKT